MGVCESKERLEFKAGLGVSQAIDQDFHEQQREHQMITCVALGPPGSGKSTWCRHMFVDLMDDRRIMKTPLRQLTWHNYCNEMIPLIKRYTIMMLKEMNRLLHYPSFVDRSDGFDVKRTDHEMSQMISQLQNDSGVPTDILPIIDKWWKADGERNWCLLREQHKERLKYPLTDATPYFMTNIAHILKNDYQPKHLDVVLCPLQLDEKPVPHISVSELVTKLPQLPHPLIQVIASYTNYGYPKDPPITEFIGTRGSGQRWRCIDINQERTERRVWIKFLQEVDSVVLVIPFSDYNEPDPSGQFPTKMAAHIDSYSCIINSKWFGSTNMSVLFTKMDMLRQKLKSSNQPRMKDCWPTYQGSEGDEKSIIEFVNDQWRASCTVDKMLFIHHVNQLDEASAGLVCQQINDINMRHNLENVG